MSFSESNTITIKNKSIMMGKKMSGATKKTHLVSIVRGAHGHSKSHVQLKQVFFIKNSKEKVNQFKGFFRNSRLGYFI